MSNFLKCAADDVTFAEYPNEVALYIEISGCPIHCPECHSKFLWEDSGIELTEDNLKTIITKNEGITSVIIGGGDQNENDVIRIIKFIKNNFPGLKVCWYSGKSELSSLMRSFIEDDHLLDSVKLGPYIKEFGPLNVKTTNQKFYIIKYNSGGSCEFIDKTELFWKSDL